MLGYNEEDALGGESTHYSATERLLAEWHAGVEQPPAVGAVMLSHAFLAVADQIIALGNQLKEQL